MNQDHFLHQIKKQEDLPLLNTQDQAAKAWQVQVDVFMRIKTV